MLHHDNAPAHASLLIRIYLVKHQTSVVPHPPYSPELAPVDFFLFPKLKTTLKGRRFQTIEVIQENAIRELCAITKCVPGSIPTMEESLGTVYRQ
jgi:transposase